MKLNNEIELVPGPFAHRGIAGQDRGLGDTVARLTHATGLDKLAEAYTKITGRPCNCGTRQEALNKLVPYRHLT